MKIFNEMLDWLEKQEKDLMSVYYHIFKSKIREMQAKYACEDLEKAGY